MQKFKKAMLTVLSMVLVAVIAVGATLAYLTDTDSDVNVMTVGNVQIEQIELQRKDGVDYRNSGEIADGDELEAFKQGQLLFPSTYTNLSDYTAKWPNDEQFWWGDYVTADVSGNGSSNGLWDDKLTGAMDKFVFVENTGKSDAYYRTIIAFECPEGMEYSQGSDKEFMMNVNGNSRFVWDTIGYTEIDGIRYLLKVATYQKILEPGTISRPSLLQVVMTHNATNEDMALLGDTYEILVVSQAVQAAGFDKAETALNTAFGKITTTAHPWSEIAPEIPVVVDNAADLTEALTAASAAKSGDNTIYLAEDIDLTEDWTPISVDGYHGAGIVTVEGQGNTITGLTAPLFDGGFAGESGIIIRDLTIADSEIKSDSTQGAGAFISCVDSMTTITLENCHLLNSTVDAPEARTGGLIGWTSGYSKQDDGPVKTYVTITDCSVIGCKITGTAVGGINGHAGASDWTFTTIENCTVLNNELISYDDGDWRVGAVVGTANIGEVTITGTVSGDNTMTQTQASSQRADGLSELVGRFVPGTTGKLTVEGTVQAATASKQEDLNKAVNSGADVITLNEGTYTIPNVSNTSYTIIGNGDDVVVDQSGKTFGLTNTDIVFENVTIKGTSENYRGLQAGDVVYNNCVFEGGNHLYSESVTFNNCTFNLTSQYITTYSATKVTFNKCTWNTAGKALLVFQDGSSVDQVVTVKDNTFNATAAAYTWNKIHVAAVSIDGSAATTNGTFAVKFEGNNTVDADFAGLCQIKGEKGNVTVTGAMPTDLTYKAE